MEGELYRLVGFSKMSGDASIACFLSDSLRDYIEGSIVPGLEEWQAKGLGK